MATPIWLEVLQKVRPSALVGARDPGFPPHSSTSSSNSKSPLASAESGLRPFECRRPPRSLPAASLKLTDAELLRIGFSRQKTLYTRLLAESLAAPLFRFARAAQPARRCWPARCWWYSKAIGKWTADIYLLSALRRSGYLADRRSGLGDGSAGSIKTPPPSPITGEKLEKNEPHPGKPWRAVAAPPILASLLEQARASALQRFRSSWTIMSLLTGGHECRKPLSRRIFSRANRRRYCRAVRILGGRLGRGKIRCPHCSITSFSAATISIAASIWSKRTPGRAAQPSAASIPAAATRNALLSLGGAPAIGNHRPGPPRNTKIVHFPQIRAHDRSAPHRLGRPSSRHRCHRPSKLGENKIAFQGPRRRLQKKRPEGRILTWKTVNLADDRHGLLPLLHRMERGLRPSFRGRSKAFAA